MIIQTDKIISLLNSIGKKCFIDYFEDFRSGKAFHTLPKKYKYNNRKTRSTHAAKIFNNNWHIEALKICAQSEKLEYSSRKRAIELLDKEQKYFRILKGE